MIEYITLSDLVKKVSQDAVEKGKEIFNTKKIREKYLNIFEMMNIDRDKLKASDGKDTNKSQNSKGFWYKYHKIPAISSKIFTKFLFICYLSLSTNDVFFHNV